jgi:hypothetical protein
MTMVNRWTIVQVLVVTDETTCGGWISPTTAKILPANIADKPASRIRFEAVIFTFLFLSCYLFGIYLRDRDQGQTQIAHLAQQAMQRGLVDARTANDGCAIALLGKAQSVEPGGPSGLEVPLEADFVLADLTISIRRCVCVTHALLPSLG